MKKVSKFIALLLAALMLMTSFAFAATGSKEEPAKPAPKAERPSIDIEVQSK